LNKKILLALLPPWGDNSHSPLGIPCISSKLVKNGFKVIKKDYNADVHSKIISKYDENFSDFSNLFDEDNYNKIIYPLLKSSIDKWAKEILKSGAAIIGFTLYLMNKCTIRKISEIIKEKAPDKIIVLGGPETSQNRDFMKWGTIDFAVTGDGELTFLQLVEAIVYSKTDYCDIKGLIYKENGKPDIIYTGDNTITNLDDLPFPDFKDIDLRKYKWNSIPIESSRGCINKCSFCSDTLLKRNYRFKSGKRLFDEVMHFVNLGHMNFAFMDSLLNGKISELEKFCDLIIESGINKGKKKITWGGTACIRKEMTLELLRKIKEAGCYNFTYGIESGSDDVLRMMNKRTTVSLAEEVLKNTYLAGIKAFVFILIGFPTETEDDFKKTLEFITRNKEYISYIFAGGGCTITPNTDLFINPEKYGIYLLDDEQIIYKYPHRWLSKETTPEIRKARIKTFVEHCRSLNVNVVSC
jgi:anaerobic magnesium-protoporphyrin IX monomethyl ester cyclase